MTTASPLPGAVAPATAYAGFAARFRALLVDTIVIMGSVMVGALLAIAAPSTELTGRILLLALVCLVLLYEPLMVSRFGATVGHRRANLMVVADRTGTRPSFPRAVLRYLIKGVLGLASFVTMAFTPRHQAVHDRLSGTTVQIRDLSKALPGDVKWEREPLPAFSLPSRTRRTVIIVVYLFLSFVAVSIIGALIQSEACLQHRSMCSAGERFGNHVLSLAWLAAMGWIVIRGWQGRLRGARRRAVASTDATPDEAVVDSTLG